MADPKFLNPVSILSYIGTVELDITRKTVQDYAVTTTKLPIEKGAAVTDHAIVQPIQLEIEGGFSDVRMNNLTGPIPGSNQAYRGRAIDKAQEILKSLQRLELFEVFDGVRVFKNMQWQNFQIVKDSPVFALAFKASLIEVIIIDTSPQSTSADQITGGVDSAVSNGESARIRTSRARPATVGVLA